METRHLIGLMLIAVGILDVLLGLFLVGPRTPEPQRKVVMGAMVGGGVAMVAAGFAFLAGLIL